jgi:DNA-binding LacI/PurR family transcriptional regulator
MFKPFIIEDAVKTAGVSKSTASRFLSHFAKFSEQTCIRVLDAV